MTPRRMKTHNTIPALAAASILIAAPALPVARAVVLASDDFNSYAIATNLSGLNGGSGWNGGYSVGAPGQGYLNEVRNASQPAAPNLAYPGYISNGGNYANLASGYGGPNFNYFQRGLDVSGAFSAFSETNPGGYNVVGADGTSLWGSFLYHNVGGLQLWLQQQTGPSSATSAQFVAPTTGSDSLFLFRIDYGSGGSDTMTIWNNPDLATWTPAGSPTSTASGNYSFSNLIFVAPNSQNEGRIDNIRLGTEAEDVVPYTAIPEPSAAILIGLAALPLARRRRLRL